MCARGGTAVMSTALTWWWWWCVEDVAECGGGGRGRVWWGMGWGAGEGVLVKGCW